MPEDGCGGWAETLRTLEEQLWRTETRYSCEFMESVLADGFVEFGASGAVYDRQTVIDAEPRDLDVELPLPDFAVRALSPDVALVTYTSVERRATGEARRARRSSVWMFGSEGWKLVFHQGMLLP